MANYPTPEQWFREMPPITKSYFVAAVATTIVTHFGLISPRYLFLDLEQVVFRFQFWRLLTCTFYFGPLSLGFLFQMFIMVRFFSALEGGYFQGLAGIANMITMLAFGAILMFALSLVEPLYFLGTCMMFLVLYVWSRKKPKAPSGFWGFRFSAWHMPFVMLLLDMVIGNALLTPFVGILVGHSYHFLADIVPAEYGVHLLYTPAFVNKCVEYFMTPAEPGAAARANWQRGQGHRLD